MALLNGQTLCDEVAWRIQNRLAANGTGAGSIINFANDVLGLISSAGSWVFDQTSALNQTPSSGGTVALNTLDVGKKIAVYNTASGTPVVRVDQDDYPSSSTGYVGIGTDWNTFRILVNAGTYDGTIQLFPATGSGNVDAYFHQVPPTLTYGANPTVRWTIQEMDDLLKDWTEAKVKQKLGMAGWDTLWADCLGRVKELRKMYTTERINTGPQDEAAGNMAEKNSVGRA